MSQPENKQTPRVARGPDKATNETRHARSEVVDGKAKSSSHWVANPDLATAGLALVQAGVALDTGDKLAAQADADATSTAEELVTLRRTWDQRFRVYVALVELVVIKPEDVTNLGCTVLAEGAYTLQGALGVTAKYDRGSSEINVAVHKPPGNFDCHVEISPDPITPGSFVEVPGKGARRTLTGYPPGLWWIQVAMVSNDGMSAFSEPVSVTVH